MKKTILNTFRLFSEMKINTDVLKSTLEAIQEDNGQEISFKFGSDATIVYTIDNVINDLCGYHKENKKLLSEGIENCINNPEELQVNY